MTELAVVCFSGFGGSGVIASELACGLAKRGHRVHMLASEPPRGKIPEHENLIFHGVEFSDEPKFDRPYALAIASAIVDVVRAHRVELVHVHYAIPHATSAFLAQQILGRDAPKSVLTLHGTDVTRFAGDTSAKALTSFAVSRADALTVPSKFLEREARRLLDVSAHIEVIPNFVDTDRFVPSGAVEPNLLVHVSNFRAVKRTLDLPEVLARVRARVPATMILVGDGPDRAAVEARARALGVFDSMTFLGKRTEFVADLNRASAFVLPSESESFGVAALEAMSAGVPVFAYRVGGLPDVVGTAGALVEPFDAGALADAIAGGITDRPKQRALALAARARALAEFRQEPAIDRYEALFRRVLGDSR